MSAGEDCEKIEKCLKDMIFNNMSSPIGPQDMKPKLNHTPFTVDDRCFVSNIEKMVHMSQNNVGTPFGGIARTDVTNQSGASELIDLNVLTNFAAQHIEDPLLCSSNMALNCKDVKLPHPELEDDCNVGIKNGEQNQGIAVLLNTISKEIQNSPNFLSMPENPLPLISGSPKKHDLFNNSHLSCAPEKNAVLHDPNQKEQAGYDKNASKKKKKAQRKLKEKKNKEKNTSSHISKDSTSLSADADKKSEISKGESNIKMKSPVASNKKRDVKSIEKGSAEDPTAPRPDIKMKKSVFASIGKEYSLFKNEGVYRLQCHICNYNTDLRDSIVKHLNSNAHLLLKAQNDLDMMLPFLPDSLPQQTEAISDLLTMIVSTHGLQKEEREIRKQLSLRLQKFVEDNVSSCSVHLIGSSASGFSLKASEVDFVLKISSNGDIPDSLEQLYLLIKEDSAFDKVVNDFKKKRPCIKFVDHETSLPCNILIDNGSSWKMANLLSAYFEMDERVQILGIALRYWGKLCEIDQQDYGTLPSFCYALFLVHFLQQVQPPVLPVLHEMKDFSSGVEFYSDVVKENKWKTENTDSVGTLWLKFFHYYHFDYKIGEDVVCIRSSKRVVCKERNWSTKFYAVEDPFIRRNLAYVIPTYQVCHYIQQCFIRTYRYFAYPQLKNGTIKLMKTESFDALKLSEYVSSKPVIKEASDESEDSENEDSDLLNASQDLEDHDPEISVDDFISTVSNLSLTESNTETLEENVEKNEELDSSDLNSPPENNLLPKKQVDKTSKENQAKANKNAQPICYWDLDKIDYTKSDFNYEFRAITFKGEKSVPLTCKLCKCSGHQKKDCPNDDIPIPKPLPPMTPEFMEIVSKVLCIIRDKNVVNQKELNSIEVDMRGVQEYIRAVFPDATLKLFGSFCNGFGFKNNSDMDFCLTFKDLNDGKDLDNTCVIERIAKELHRHPELENIVSITSAKVPIVKFSWRRTGIEGDISLYNTLALANTEMLEIYSKIDPRVQILGYALKHFAKHLGICDASRGSLSSYAYILMVLFFLQQRNPPVIPVLQELYDDEKPSVLIEGWNVWFFKDLNRLKDVWTDYGKNKENIGELWLGLLCFYTCDFDWQEYVISIKQKKLLTRFRKLWITNQLAIEDPFDLNHNLGAGLSRKMNSYIMKAFIRARERFGSPIPLEKLLRDPEGYLFHRTYLNSGVEPPQDRGCSNCGKIGHIARNCPQEKACSYCRKVGHLIKNCPRKGRGKKSRERTKDRKRSYETPNSDRKDGDERRNAPSANTVFKNEFMRPFPGMQPQSTLADLRQGQKYAQLGVPAHRLPPPSFVRNITSNPPPGFKPGIPLPQGIGNYPPPFSLEPPIMPPFPRSGNKNDPHAQSPPKQYSSSPPKGFPLNKPAFHQSPDSSWPIGRPGFYTERHPAPQVQRNIQVERHSVRQALRNMQVERHLAPQQLRTPANHPWQDRKSYRMAAPNSTNSDNVSYNSNHSDKW